MKPKQKKGEKVSITSITIGRGRSVDQKIVSNIWLYYCSPYSRSCAVISKVIYVFVSPPSFRLLLFDKVLGNR
jgi:hypothetical protein